MKRLAYLVVLTGACLLAAGCSPAKPKPEPEPIAEPPLVEPADETDIAEFAAQAPEEEPEPWAPKSSGGRVINAVGRALLDSVSQEVEEVVGEAEETEEITEAPPFNPK